MVDDMFICVLKDFFMFVFVINFWMWVEVGFIDVDFF